MRKQTAMQLGAKYLLTLGKLDIEPHPLLAPILTVEPRKNGSENTKTASPEAVHPAWCTIRDAILTLVHEGDHSFPRLEGLS